MSTILIGMTFFKNCEVMIDIVNYLIHLPEMSLQLKQKNGKFKQPLSEMTSEQTVKLQPGQQVIIPARTDGLKTDTHGTVEEHPVFHRRSSILVTPAMTTVKGGIAHIQITNPTQQVCTIRKGTAVASFKILTPNQAKYVKEMPPTHINLLQRFPEDAEAVVNQLFREQNEVLNRKWYPTPETCSDPTKLNPLERRIYDEIIELRKIESLDPTKNEQMREEFLSNFKDAWTDSFLYPEQIERIKDALAIYHLVFARHRFDIFINMEFKIKLTPKHDEPVWSSSS